MQPDCRLTYELINKLMGGRFDRTISCAGAGML
jgi:hypothetical protein